MYLYTLFSAFFKIVPIVSTSMIGIIGGMQMYLSHDKSFLLSVSMIVVYMAIDARLQTDIYMLFVNECGTKPYLIGMSVFLGYYAFDLQGIFYGPLLTCLVPIVYKNLEDYTDQDVPHTPQSQEENNSPSVEIGGALTQPGS